jgi:hypothetical protein
MGRTEILTWTDYERALVGMALVSRRAKWRSSLSGWSSVGKKVLDNAGIVREACLRQARKSLLHSRAQPIEKTP